MAAVSLASSVENDPVAPICAAAGASPSGPAAVAGTTRAFSATIASASSSCPRDCARCRHTETPIATSTIASTATAP